MAPRRATRNIQNDRQQCSAPPGEQPPPQDIEKEPPHPSPRRSSRLQHRQEPTVPNGTNTDPTVLVHSDSRKRSQEPQRSSSPSPPESLRKQQRTSLADSAAQHTLQQGPTSGINDNKATSIARWNEDGSWPNEYVSQADTRKDFENDNEIPWLTEMGLNHLLARKKSPLRDKQSDAGAVAGGSTTASDEDPWEAKSTAYEQASYEAVLAAKGIFMDNSEPGIAESSKRLCRTLLESQQLVPRHSLFSDELFYETCERVRTRNQAMVARDIMPLICPSVQLLGICGARHLNALNESVGESWNCAEPFYSPRPQPNYCVGFGRAAFNHNQLEKLKPFVGDVPDCFTSHFMATYQMYFPFLTCEVKCGTGALDVADRQNAHSMALAVRGVVDLFRMVKREMELHREILAFSVSHDHRTVRIYGHYPMINGETTTFHRHAVHTFDFMALNGSERWTAHQFCRNVYDLWMPTQLRRICAVIDALPLDSKVSTKSEEGESGLSQGLENHHLSDGASHDAMSADVPGNQSSRGGSRNVTPNTPPSQGINMEARPMQVQPLEVYQICYAVWRNHVLM